MEGEAVFGWGNWCVRVEQSRVAQGGEMLSEEGEAAWRGQRGGSRAKGGESRVPKSDSQLAQEGGCVWGVSLPSPLKGEESPSPAQPWGGPDGPREGGTNHWDRRPNLSGS